VLGPAPWPIAALACAAQAERDGRVAAAAGIAGVGRRRPRAWRELGGLGATSRHQGTGAGIGASFRRRRHSAIVVFSWQSPHT